MTVRIRLQRFGRKNRPFYRIVSCDSRSPRDGKFLQILGTYSPLPSSTGVKEVRLDIDRCRYWLSVGAQPSDVVRRLFGMFGVGPERVKRYQRETGVPKDKRAFSTIAEALSCGGVGGTMGRVGGGVGVVNSMGRIRGGAQGVMFMSGMM